MASLSTSGWFLHACPKCCINQKTIRARQQSQQYIIPKAFNFTMNIYLSKTYDSYKILVSYNYKCLAEVKVIA